MPIKGAFILPHGSLILDPSIENLDQQAHDLNAKMHKITKMIKKMNPELCLLVTPHGISHLSDYLFYNNEYAAGTAEWDNKYSDFSVNVQVETEILQNLVNTLQKTGLPVNTVTSFTKSVTAPLRWGEVVPLWFLKRLKLKYHILSIPSKRISHAIEMISELQLLGQNLIEFYSELNSNVILIISGDLSHTHSKESSYGFQPEAEQFDKLIVKWINHQDSSPLIDQAPQLLNKALCCGFSGLVILDEYLKNALVQPVIHSYSHPTYYGMLIASFVDKRNS
ncbi:MAG: AmmeMemoRadiSam system protein B [Candidatus Hodarchaeales archaeon]|jgi:aromatic ring-opening dioxygenase LigB subunit